MRDAMLSHLPLLVGENALITSRHSAAQQNIAFRLVFGEICIWVVVFDASFEQPSSAGEAAALVADCRQNNSVGRSGIPDVLIFAAINRAGAFRSFQHYPKAPLVGHHSFDA
ncbi:MAG: hypothetical protein QOH35_5088 [Acidobacteriaceae bacterium]|jgi:hypothetical protein|nr:hypothetical protein [Acidobacteriaceae bacterium]